MAVQVYITFNGNCREAVNYYAQIIGAEKPLMMKFGEMPPEPGFELPESAKELIMHTELNISGSTVMFSDNMPGMPFTAGNNFSLTIVSKDLSEITDMYNKLKEGGTVTMELQETFWSKCYGALTDKFGIAWQFSLESEPSVS